MPTTASSLPYPVLTDDNNPPQDIRLLAEGVDAVYGAKVANFGALPVAGKFAGQRVWLIDVGGYATWDGTAWRRDTARSIGGTLTTAAPGVNGATPTVHNITFPVGLFTAAPILTFGTTQARNSPEITSLSATAATITVYNLTSVGGATGITHWVATQF